MSVRTYSAAIQPEVTALIARFAHSVIAARPFDQLIDREGDPYIERWYLARKNVIPAHRSDLGEAFLGFVPSEVENIYLHRYARADVEEPHCHPWKNATLVIDGWYTEDVYEAGVHVGSFRRSPGDIVLRAAHEVHAITGCAPGTIMRGSGKYAGHAARLLPLRRYLIAAICTLGRPDAILDMNVKRERGQWMQNERRFALNQEGRIQTKKVRPVMPVVDLLHSWLSVTDEWFVCMERTRHDEDQQIDVVEQIGVKAVRSGWDSARAELKLPDGWGPKLIRHSMATILANRRVDLVELEIALGHRPLGKTSSRYAIFDPDYLATIRDGIEGVAADLTSKAGQALHPSFTRVQDNITVLRA